MERLNGSWVPSMERLNGHWVPSTSTTLPPAVLHIIDQGRVFWDDGTGKSWRLRADPEHKYGPDHFSIGERKRKGTRPSTLRKCILRSSCTLEWMSPGVEQCWIRFAPNLASLETLQLVTAEGSDLASVLVDLKHEKCFSQIVNVEKLRYFARVRCVPSSQTGIVADDLSLTEVATGKVLKDNSDLSSSGHPPVVKVSTYIADMISRNALELVFSDGKHRDIDLSHVMSGQDVFVLLSQQTKRPAHFITLETRDKDGQLQKLERLFRRLPDPAVIQVHLTETVSEWWLSNRLIIVGPDGQRCHSDLSEAGTLWDACEIIGRDTSRPGRFVRFLLEGNVLKEWTPSQFPDSLTLTLQLAPCIHELLEGVPVTYISGEALDVDSTGLVGIQDLREAIAAKLKLRATHVSLISRGESLWDSMPFGLLEAEAITVCIRSPELCAQGEHEICTFSNNGYNDRICIHCGRESYMEGRMRQPAGDPFPARCWVPRT
ncbi:unnamed protein product [Effrenium voratum]|nr:unnamed protein product [Effrenium voratum]